MGPRGVVVRHIFPQDPSEMSLAQHDQVIQTFPPDLGCG